MLTDLDGFPVAKAVATSSAVPVVFLPVVLENYPDCGSAEPPWLKTAKQRAVNDPLAAEMTKGIDSLLAKDRRRYMHLIDGGITDNLGLHALYDIITLELMKQSLRKWADELKTPEHTVETHFIRIGLRGVKNPEHRLFFNKIPTSFALSQEQVDRLVSGGRNLLLDDPEYQRAVAALGGSIQGRN